MRSRSTVCIGGRDRTVKSPRRALQLLVWMMPWFQGISGGIVFVFFGISTMSSIHVSFRWMMDSFLVIKYPPRYYFIPQVYPGYNPAKA
jgi:hypothetical protein